MGHGGVKGRVSCAVKGEKQRQYEGASSDGGVGLQCDRAEALRHRAGHDHIQSKT